MVTLRDSEFNGVMVPKLIRTLSTRSHRSHEVYSRSFASLYLSTRGPLGRQLLRNTAACFQGDSPIDHSPMGISPPAGVIIITHSQVCPPEFCQKYIVGELRRSTFGFGVGFGGSANL